MQMMCNCCTSQENLERWIPDEAAREKTAAKLKDYLDRWDEVMDQLPAEKAGWLMGATDTFAQTIWTGLAA